MKLVRQIKLFLLVVLACVLIGCQTSPELQVLREKQNPDLAPSYRIANFPFYPSTEFPCAVKGSLEVANFYHPSGKTSGFSDQTLTRIKTYTSVPDVAHELGLLAYHVKGDLSQVANLLNQDIPLLVQSPKIVTNDNKTDYMLLTGYQLGAETLTISRCKQAAHSVSFSSFVNRWEDLGAHMWVLLPAGKSSPFLNPDDFLAASLVMLKSQHKEPARQALKTAIQQWPEYWKNYYYLANDYVPDNVYEALKWYEKGFDYGRQSVAYLNNYAYALGKAYCFKQAENMLSNALKLGSNKAALMDSRAQLMFDKKSAVLIQNCPLHDKF